MNDMPLSFYITSIDHQIEENKDQLAAIFEMEYGPTKVHALISMIAQTEAELLFIRSSMKDEMDKRNSKPFWKFWK